MGDPMFMEGHIVRVDEQAATAYSTPDLLLTTTFGGAPITPKHSGRLRISVAFSTSAILSKVVDSGGTAVTTLLNNGDPLEANAEAEFEFDVTQAHTYDFSYAASGSCLKCVVKEV